MKHIKIWRVVRIIALVVMTVLFIGVQPSPLWAAPPYFGFGIRAGSTGDDSAIAVGARSAIWSAATSNRSWW